MDIIITIDWNFPPFHLPISPPFRLVGQTLSSETNPVGRRTSKIDEQKMRKKLVRIVFVCAKVFLLDMTYGSEENVDVLRPRVDDNVVDVSLLDLAQHLAVSVDRSLTDVHFHFARRRRSHQILQPQQT